MLRTPSIRLGGQDYLVPNSNINIDPLMRLKKTPLPAPNQFTLNISDLLLASSLNSFHQLKISDARQYATVMTDEPLQQELLKSIQTYPAQYRGRVTPEATAGCQLVAGKLHDTYSTEKRHFTRQKFLDNDYLGIIAHEQSRGNGIVAFGPSWVLPAVAEYVNKSLNYDSVRTAVLREDILEMNPRGNIDWTNDPGTLPDQFIDVTEESLLATGKIVTRPTPKVFELNQLNIYQFYDRNFLEEDGNLMPIYMMFAPVTVDEMERILLYLNRNIKLYSFWHSLAIEDLPLSAGSDFKYLFPVEISYVGNYTVISSAEISQNRLMHIYHLQEVPFSMPRIDDILGTYATYLLAEALFYEFEVWWNKRSLLVGMAGWIQAHDIYEQFGLILNDINRQNMRFVKLDNYLQATRYADQTNAKCFYYLGNYYAAINEEVIVDRNIQPETSPVSDPGLLEMINPLRGVVQVGHRRNAKKYLQSLGYDITPNPETLSVDLQLGHRTFEIEGKQVTVYYYRSTHNQELEVHQIDGPNNEKLKKELERLLQQGYFFDQKTKNTVKGYPGFIPSCSPVEHK
jgi:hypothetical protein